MSQIARSVLALSWVLALSPLCAQGPRDPTLPPPDVGLAAPTGAKTPASASEATLSIIARDGQLFVVQGTRLLGLGQKMGEAHIERITETDVWLRQRGVLTKRPLFAGIARRSIAQEDVGVSLQFSRSSP